MEDPLVGLLHRGDRTGDGGGDAVAVVDGEQVEQGAAEEREHLGTAGGSNSAHMLGFALVRREDV
jgi:hypothetical protein